MWGDIGQDFMVKGNKINFTDDEDKNKLVTSAKHAQKQRSQNNYIHIIFSSKLYMISIILWHK